MPLKLVARLPKASLALIVAFSGLPAVTANGNTETKVATEAAPGFTVRPVVALVRAPPDTERMPPVVAVVRAELVMVSEPLVSVPEPTLEPPKASVTAGVAVASRLPKAS